MGETSPFGLQGIASKALRALILGSRRWGVQGSEQLHGKCFILNLQLGRM